MSSKLNKTKIFHPDELPDFLDQEDFAEFLSMQDSVLDKFETHILNFEKGEFEKAPSEIKKIIHTMKGESGFLGLNDVGEICHLTEDYLEQPLSIEFADLLFKVKDWLAETFSYYRGSTKKPGKKETIVELFLEFKEKQYLTKNAPSNLDDDSLKHKEKYQNQPDLTLDSTPSSISIELKRLDELIDCIGELTIAEAMVTSGKIIKSDNYDHEKSLKALTSVTRQLQKIGLDLRMINLKGLFNRMARLARDLKKKSKKDFEFYFEGESTKLDKSLVDGLSEPLIHMIRNCVDHGIEQHAYEREQSGKKKTAKISLKAYQKGSNFFLEVIDDGIGIDSDKLIKKAVSKGLIRNQTELEKDEIINLIFHPGLSTAEKVTDISGRGIGMDVVRSKIGEFKGQVQVVSDRGKGTTFIIKLPLTLAMLDGIFVRVGDEKFVFPTLSIVTLIKPNKDMIASVLQKGEMLKLNNSLIPIIKLFEYFNINDCIKNLFEGILIVVESSGIKTAIFVDELIEKRSIVRKNLNLNNYASKGISGGAVMPDGSISLILDIDKIVEPV